MIGAGIAVLTGIGAGFGIGIATSKAAEAIASWAVRWQRQPLSMVSLLHC